MTANGIFARNLSVGYGESVLIRNFNLELRAFETHCLLGPNGVGKTTLFRTIMGFIPPLSGTITLEGKDIRTFQRKKLARLLSYVPQMERSVFSFTAEEVVLMGRMSEFGFFNRPSAKDRKITELTLERFRILPLRDRPFLSLSGGEKQLILIARAMVGEPTFLLMDEPTSGLDFHNQARVLAAVNELRLSGISILMTTHNPDHVFQCGSSATLLGKDYFRAEGPVEEVMTEENLTRAYGMEVKILSFPGDEGLRVCRGVPEKGIW
jgi:iron complex transport system ATP-binding protein